MTNAEYDELEKGDKLYYGRIMPSLGYYEIFDVSLVTKYDNHCTVSDSKSKQSFIFIGKDINEKLYVDRQEALKYIKDMKKKYKNIKVITDSDEK